MGVCGKHDRDLLMGAARHGLGRTDFYYVHDPELAYREILRRHYAGEPLIYPQEKKERDKIEDAMKLDKIDSSSESEIDSTKKKEINNSESLKKKQVDKPVVYKKKVVDDLQSSKNNACDDPESSKDKDATKDSSKDKDVTK